MSFGVLFVIGNVLAILVIRWMYHYKKSKVLLFTRRILLIGYSLFILSFILVEYAILKEAYTQESFDPGNIDFVLILGAGLKGEVPSKTLQGRLDAGLKYLLDNKDIPVIVSGGQGPGETITEAEAMGTYLISNGLEEERIFFESLATNTNENLQYSVEMMNQMGKKNPRVLIVTSDYHLLRAKMLAKERGLVTYGLAGDSPVFVKVNYFIREYFGMAKDYIFLNISM